MKYSLQRLLVILGLVIIPFYELIMKAFPYMRSIAPDTRAPKQILAVMFALSIGLLAVFQGTLKPFKNKWFLLIPIYLLFSLSMAPHVDIFINNVESGDFYFWKPFAFVLCFTLMVVAIASMDVIENILEVMVICGAVMAGYVILQNFGFDQFWAVRTPPQWTAPYPQAELGGNLGQCTIVASFMVMIVPLAFYLRKYWMGILIVISILVTQSDMAALSLIVMALLLLMYFKKSFIIPAVVIGFIILTSSIFLINKNSDVRNFVKTHSSGRIFVWKNTYKDIRDGAIDGMKQDQSATGYGLGRFSVLFQENHKSEFQQAHNDLLEFTYNCGFVGLVLLITAIGFMVINVLTNVSSMCFAILLSFVGILFCSLGSFPFQLGAHQFYSAVILGLLHNELVNRRLS